MQIDDMPAGREMDALVLKHVFGVEFRQDGEGTCLRWRDADGEPTNQLNGIDPSTDIAAAWEVVEKLSKDDGCAHHPIRIMDDRYNGVYSGGYWIASFGNECMDPWGCDNTAGQFWIELKRGEWPQIHMASAASMPLAICRAALKAVGYKYEAKA